MTRFETSITNPYLAAKLSGLDPQVVRLARDPVAVQRLDDFITSQVAPEFLDFHIEGVGGHRYVHTRLSAVGLLGTMIHVRLHEQLPLQQMPTGLSHAVVIGQLDGSEDTEPWTAIAQDTVHYDGTRTSIFTMGDLPEPTLQVVDGSMTEEEWELEQLLEDEAMLAAAPQLEISTRAWRFRRADGSWEPIRDIHEVRRKVGIAIDRGLGKAATQTEVQAAVLELRPTGSDE